MITRGQEDYNLNAYRNLLDGKLDKQENTIYFINYNPNVDKEKEGGSYWSILLYTKKENNFSIMIQSKEEIGNK